jgi:cysteinyl-tRNA synthetase
MKHAFHILYLGLSLLFYHTAFAQTRALSDIQDFVYQLQNIDLAAIGETGFDLVVIDYSSDGGDESVFSRAQIDILKHSPGGEKIVLSYLSIGEAEDYRFYWQSDWKPGNPSWLDLENSEWKGNYKVRYWDQGWRDIIFQYLDKILGAGFDGIYCDIIDAYEYYQEKGRSAAAAEMADFVAAIRSYARALDPDFFIFVQNAAELAVTIPSYLNTVDGIGQEDIYYTDGMEVPAEVTAELEGHLKLFKDAGKPVLTIDYPFAFSIDVPHFDAPTRAKIDRAYSLSRANGFVPYCTVRNLSFLTINPGHEPVDVRLESTSLAHPRFMLLPNYPNPFNGETVITYHVFPVTKNPEVFETPGFSESFVALKILNVFGCEIAVPFQGRIQPGTHKCRWDGRDRNGGEVPGGVYMVQLEGEGMKSVHRIVLLR